MVKLLLPKLKKYLIEIFWPTQSIQSFVEDSGNFLILRLKYSKQHWQLVDLCCSREQQEKFKDLPLVIGIDDNLVQVRHIQVPKEVNYLAIYSYIEENFADYFPNINKAHCFWDFYSYEDTEYLSEKRVIIVLAEQDIIDKYIRSTLICDWRLMAIVPWCFVSKPSKENDLFAEIHQRLPANFPKTLIEKAICLAMHLNF